MQEASNELPDILQVYFGGDIQIDDFILMHHPTIGEIVEYGETRFWSTFHQFCGNTTSMRVPLWKAGINWNKITDWELFASLCRLMPVEDTKIVFGDFDFQKLSPVEVTSETENEKELTSEEKKDIKPEIVLIDMDNPDVQINEAKYHKIMSYLRVMIHYFPKNEFTKSKLLAESIIDEELMNARAQQQVNESKGIKPKWRPSILFPVISGCVNNPGFKYSTNEILNMPIFQFFDSFHRLQVYSETQSLGVGRFMLVDLSGIDLAKELNWARDIYEDQK